MNNISKALVDRHNTDIEYKNKISNQLKANALAKKGTRQPKKRNWLQLLQELTVHHSSIGHNYVYNISSHDLGTHDYIRVYCLDHKVWFKTVIRNHLPKKDKNGSCCPQCRNKSFSDKFLKTKEQFIQDLTNKWGNDFVNLVSFGEYFGTRKLIQCKCNKCSYEYQQLPNDILTHGYSCPQCANIRSKGEEEVYNYILSLGINKEDIILRSKSIIKPKELDVYLPKHNLAIEFHGLYWHSESKVGKRLHYDKYLACKNQGIRLIQIYEDEWINKKEIVKNIIKQSLNINSNKVYARNCNIEIINKDTTKEFLNKNHIQGFSTGKVYLSLKHNSIIVAVMVLGQNKSLRGETNTWELIRYATNTNVVGGMSKLFKNFINNYNPSKVITYSDNDKFTGNSYYKLGFNISSLVKPNYYSIWGRLDRKHKSSTKKSNLAKILKDQYDSNKTEFELFSLLGGNRIWNSGQIKWVWNNI